MSGGVYEYITSEIVIRGQYPLLSWHLMSSESSLQYFLFLNYMYNMHVVANCIEKVGLTEYVEVLK